MNEGDIKKKVFILILVLGIGAVVQSIHNIEMDDEPARLGYAPMINVTGPSYIGTASINPIRL